MQCICQRSLAIRTTGRAFSTSARKCIGLGLNANDERVVKDTVPPWPYGPTQLYKQSAQGLYGGARIRFGNNTSEKRTKTRRTWLPNIRPKRLFSKALNRNIHIRVSTRVLRTIDKLGGLDEYLLGEKEARIKELGEAGWWLRWAIMQTNPVKARYAAQRVALGLPPVAEPQDIPDLQEVKAIDLERAPESESVSAISSELEGSDQISEQDANAQTVGEDSSLQTETKESAAFLADAESQENTSLEFPETADTETPELGAEAYEDINNVSQIEEFTAFEPRSLLDHLEQNKRKLLFRVGRYKYLQLSDGEWVPLETQRERLIEGLKMLSPTASLKYWEDPSNRPEGLAAEQFFAARKWIYQACLAAFEQVRPFQRLNLEKLPKGLQQTLDAMNKQSLERSVEELKAEGGDQARIAHLQRQIFILKEEMQGVSAADRRQRRSKAVQKLRQAKVAQEMPTP